MQWALAIVNFIGFSAALIGQQAPDLLSPFSTTLISLGGFGLMIVLLLTGRLHTHGEYVGMERSCSDIKTDRDAWRKSAEREHELRLTHTVLLEASLETGKTVLEVMNSIRDVNLNRDTPTRRPR